MDGKAARRHAGFNSGFNRGFNLIELMVVLAIAAILGSIGFSSYFDALRKTRRAEGRAALLQLMQQQEAYYSRHHTYAAFSARNPNGFKWHSGPTPANSSYEVTAQACTGESLQGCVLLVARPGTSNVNRIHRDDPCGDLLLTSAGVQGASAGAAGCW